MTLLELANKKLAIETVFAQIVIIGVVIYLLFLRKKFPALVVLFGKYWLVLVFLVSLASMAGSLFYSNIAGFAPCDLCWWQRIFMYPLAVLSGLALLKRPFDFAQGESKKIIDYLLALSVCGAAVSLFHNFIYYYNGGLSVFCNVGGSQVSCIKRYVFEFGYITIPLMSLTAFTLIIIFMVFAKLHERRP